MNQVKIVLVDEKTFMEGKTLQRKLNSTFTYLMNVSYLGLTDMNLGNHTYYKCHRFMVVGFDGVEENE